MPLRGIGTGRVRRHLNAEVNIINLVDVVLRTRNAVETLLRPVLGRGVRHREAETGGHPGGSAEKPEHAKGRKLHSLHS